MVKCMHGNGSFLLLRKTFYSEEWLKGDSPGGVVDKNSPSNARDLNEIPGLGTKIPRASGQLSPCTTTRERITCLK